MKVLIFWDIYWRIWRSALKKELPNLRDKYNPDFIVVNIDNISSWRWAILKHIQELKEIWVDLMTGWDHIFDNISKIWEYLNSEETSVIRPLNIYESEFYKTDWVWHKIIEKNWKKLLVIHLMWEVFTKFRVDNPFIRVNELLKNIDKKEFDGIIIDFHKEASSEWYWLAKFLDSKVSLIYWTHTHVQTNDEHILDWWTWLISDIWMNGSYDSVIWADYKSVEKMFLTWILKWKIEQSLDKKYLINWIFVEIWEELRCEKIEKIKIKWVL